jgi:hypothetical protein
MSAAMAKIARPSDTPGSARNVRIGVPPTPIRRYINGLRVMLLIPARR